MKDADEIIEKENWILVQQVLDACDSVISSSNSFQSSNIIKKDKKKVISNYYTSYSFSHFYNYYRVK
jgi:hypothetical protein